MAHPTVAKPHFPLIVIFCFFLLAGCEADKTQPVLEAVNPSEKIPSKTVSPITSQPMQTANNHTPTSDKKEEISSAEKNNNLTPLELAKKSGCLACHKVKVKVVGPAWKDVAARYKADKSAKNKLIAKIKKGGKGNWTKVTGGAMMPPYSPRVSDENIALLVDFILQLE